MRPLHLIVAITFLVYGSVVTLGFVSDDHGLITHPSTGVAQQSLAQIFTLDLWHFQESQAGYYRPLMMLSLKLDHLLFGDWAGGYHLHSLACTSPALADWNAVWSTLWRNTRSACRRHLCLHPLLTEQVAFISARNDSMATALALAALWQVGSRQATRRQCMLATFLAAAACLSKETGIVVLGLLPLIDWARRRGAVGWHRYAAVVTGVTMAFFVREVIGPGLLHTPKLGGAEVVQEERVAIIGHMLTKLTWPWPLTDSTHIAYLSAVDAIPVLTTLVLMAVASLMGGRWGRIGVVFALVSLVPGMLAVASRFLIAERYLGLAVLGLGIAIAATAPRKKQSLWVLLLLLPGAWSITERISDWKTDLTLAESAHRVAPTPYTAAWLGYELSAAGQAKRALVHLDEATAGSPPTCDFAGEWIKLTRRTLGPDTALAAANEVWKRGCAGGPGVRGEWALTHLEAVDVASARQILTPRPTTCTPSLAIPVIVISLLDGGLEQAKHCARTSKVPQHLLQPEIDRLLATLTQSALAAEKEDVPGDADIEVP